MVTQGLHHLGITVGDVELAESFFVNQLGFEKAGGKPEYPARFVRDDTIKLTLWQVKDQNDYSKFNRHKNIGMHHFALKLSENTSIDEIHTRLNKAGIEIEFAPEPLGDSGLRHMMCYIPKGPRLELLA